MHRAFYVDGLKTQWTESRTAAEKGRMDGGNNRGRPQVFAMDLDEPILEEEEYYGDATVANSEIATTVGDNCYSPWLRWLRRQV